MFIVFLEFFFFKINIINYLIPHYEKKLVYYFLVKFLINILHLKKIISNKNLFLPIGSDKSSLEPVKKAIGGLTIFSVLF